VNLPEKWREFLVGTPALEVGGAAWQKSVEARKFHTVYPPEETVFAAFELTPPDAVKVVILGQDPYHEEHQATGLAFAVPEDAASPPSLRNIRKEFEADLGVPPAPLQSWAEHGVLLLNAVLTVNAQKAGSHAAFGWELFTDEIIRQISRKSAKTAFILWGNFAQKKRALIDGKRHLVVVSAHPSPLSAHRGFFGSKPFSQVEKFFDGNWCWPRS